MSEVSKLYTSKQTIYRKNSGRKSSRSKHGDVKHIVFKDGVPVMTEIIRVNGDAEEKSNRREKRSGRVIKTRTQPSRQRRSTEEVVAKKREKLNGRLKKAVQQSQTLWSEKEGIWISYQGSSGFLVKKFDRSNRCESATMMTQQQIIDSSIPGILDTGWEVV